MLLLWVSIQRWPYFGSALPQSWARCASADGSTALCWKAHLLQYLLASMMLSSVQPPRCVSTARFMGFTATCGTRGVDWVLIGP
jgi:hypothetical protein